MFNKIKFKLLMIMKNCYYVIGNMWERLGCNRIAKWHWKRYRMCMDKGWDLLIKMSN